MTTANKNVMTSIAAQNTQDSFQKTHSILPLDCFGNGTQTEAGRNMQGECVHVKLCVYMGVCGAQSVAVGRMRRQTVRLSFPTTI